MAIAGKVAITLSTENGGAWSADVTYDRLVAVKHNNNLYISRKTVANVEPPNNEFWFLALEGFGGDDVQALIDRLNELSDLIQAIINGTTQVGNAKTIDGHGAEYFFPKSGGTVGDGTRQTPVSYRGTSTAYTKYEKSDGTLLGHLGFGGLNKPVYQGSDNVARELLHTGNKPTGTYTGNGSAEQRTINTGGIGDLCIVYSYKGLCIVTPKGGALFEGQYRWLAGITFYNGVLTLATDDVFVNESGTGFSYLIP